MKYRVGDLLVAKEAMIIMNGVDGEGDEEEVEKGQYFIIVNETIEESKQKISEAHKGKIVSEEIRNKIGQANAGKKRSEETKQKMSEISKNKPETIEHLRKINTGKKRTEETKNKISEAHRKRKNNKHYTFDKDSNKYRVRIWGNHIGYYNTEEEAKQAVVVNLEKLKVQQIV